MCIDLFAQKPIISFQIHRKLYGIDHLIGLFAEEHRTQDPVRLFINHGFQKSLGVL